MGEGSAPGGEGLSWEQLLRDVWEHGEKIGNELWSAGLDRMKNIQRYWLGAAAYQDAFSAPGWRAAQALIAMKNRPHMGPASEEAAVREEVAAWEKAADYLDLFGFAMRLAGRGLAADYSAMYRYQLDYATEAALAWLRTWFGGEGEDLARFEARQARLLDLVVHEYPRAIQAIESQYGFHFDNGGYSMEAETDRFVLYRVHARPGAESAPSEAGSAASDEAGPAPAAPKAVLIVPPYVLGANILAFLPAEGRSYVHAFADRGIPTYIRVVKDIATTPTVQTMTGEDDARDLRFFCQRVMARHGRPATLNGYCQGGFSALCALLSGELDGLVDAFITCVAPMDGTRSSSLAGFLEELPARFKHLGYATKTLPNGNPVVDGTLMSWVYKLRSIDREAPLVTFHRDLKLLDHPDAARMKISNTAAAINYWLTYDRTDLPPAVTELSYRSYTIPIAADGTLPVTLFGRRLNLKRLQEKGIPWQICIAERDDLVERECALAPLDHVDAEVAVFPKGHVAIATSWSLPGSACALDGRFGAGYRGPVRFHLDLEAEPTRSRTEADNAD